ncbi:hypothetical protein ADJ70_05415 [Olsenella sp. oral taxon 807]|uniref:hypothetical protein n=1 Tax=Olsenella sp. oral taxon 807 TaxID=712411 RepID=UPI00067A376C|nr:hypothetical protein [Olsenella sp. oral taxon 807]AKT48514.1 hypothetical protein ADJ70_05415 [Olsenella sp. oral taxon 807]
MANAEAGTAYVSIVPSMRGFESLLGGGIGTAMAGVAAQAAAMEAAIGATAKAAFDAYSDYEQLVGGVDTLFGDASAQVQQYASQAYETAGVSANQYMEQVTSFAASLRQSLGGDVAEAARLGNQAIVDMGDNANKMGTDVEMIQHAYQGFAKQNYTMLDNLKLGRQCHTIAQYKPRENGETLPLAA